MLFAARRCRQSRLASKPTGTRNWNARERSSLPGVSAFAREIAVTGVRTIAAAKIRESGGESMSETLEARVKAETITAMKARDGERTTTLRLITTALKNKAIEKRAKSDEPVTDAETQQILATMIKQRRDSIEQFTKGGRPELAAKEAAEIVVIEEFLPKALSSDELAALVGSVVAQVSEGAGAKPTPKEMGTVIKAVQARLAADGLRAEGRLVSEAVKVALA
jgi:uncharacterized protein YqeY